MQRNPPCRLMIIDDHEVLRYGLILRLRYSEDIQVCGDFGTSEELFSAMAAAPADVVVADFGLAPWDISGVALVRLLRKRHPATQVLVLSAQPSAERLAIEAGAHRFLNKSCEGEEIEEAVRAMFRSRCFGSFRQRGNGRSPDGHGSALVDHPSLTPREREVLGLCLQGLSATQVAQRLQRRINTISTQRRSGMRKLGISNDNELLLVKHLIGTQDH